MARYPYIIPGDNIYKPWIGVRLGYKKTHKITPAPIVALIHFGADVCFCEKNIGLWLGAKLTHGEVKTFTTANRGTFDAIKENLMLYACGKSIAARFILLIASREKPQLFLVSLFLRPF